LKILYLINSLKPGGKERQLVELIKGLKKYKHIKIQVVVMDDDIYYDEICSLNVKLHYLVRSYKKDIKIFSQLYSICKDFNPSIIHTWDSMTSFYVLPIAKFFKIKLINGAIRNANPIKKLSLNWFLTNLTFPHYDKIISNSLAGLKQYKISRDKALCIHNGFDFNRLSSLKTSKEVKNNLGIKKEKIVGMVASFYKKKDWVSFFKSSKTILSKRDDVVFLAVGNGPLLEKMKSFVGDEVQGKIIFLSNYHPVEEIINVFNIGVLTTNARHHKEGISNSIMEYMAMGKPVIATDCGGNNELVVHGSTGILIKNKSSKTLTQNILKFIDSPGYSRKLGQLGRKRIKESFNINIMINDYKNLYEMSLKNINYSQK
tara:strand:+ start:29620 stop:30738 length:1119 start_codon:yes stop_codon:yes gene_type:complete